MWPIMGHPRSTLFPDDLNADSRKPSKDRSYKKLVPITPKNQDEQERLRRGAKVFGCHTSNISSGEIILQKSRLVHINARYACYTLESYEEVHPSLHHPPHQPDPCTDSGCVQRDTLNRIRALNQVLQCGLLFSDHRHAFPDRRSLGNRLHRWPYRDEFHHCKHHRDSTFPEAQELVTNLNYRVSPA